MAGSNAIRGARVGSGPMGEMDHGVRAERKKISYWDALGNETVRYFAAEVADEDIPEQIDSPTTGLPAGQDQKNPPELAKNEPYKTHLAYVKERRTPEEAEELLEAALLKLRQRRGTAKLSA
ncbi:MAG: RNA polymerase-binding protein RbpA [Leucobacter sp.]|uniref:RNA polymerase-binding protein RbpA n=1 Tax=Leucobacter sp. G161 TaxID=663704 RepID=UPI0009F8E8DD|nr:RNA polymerase-binding protein RbpA [Leucobacter sp. G161]MBP6684666.1 RNA polymerase-binding protein RbpA [Leucobacter sp.]